MYLTFDNQHFYYIVEPSKSEIEENLTVGGQEGAYPAKLCIDIDTALKVAKTFAEIGAMEKSVIWESDGVVAIV